MGRRAVLKQFGAPCALLAAALLQGRWAAAQPAVATVGALVLSAHPEATCQSRLTRPGSAHVVALRSPNGVLVPSHMLRLYPDERVCVVGTGAPGAEFETMRVLEGAESSGVGGVSVSVTQRRGQDGALLSVVTVGNFYDEPLRAYLAVGLGAARLDRPFEFPPGEWTELLVPGPERVFGLAGFEFFVPEAPLSSPPSPKTPVLQPLEQPTVGRRVPHERIAVEWVSEAVHDPLPQLRDALLAAGASRLSDLRLATGLGGAVELGQTTLSAQFLLGQRGVSSPLGDESVLDVTFSAGLGWNLLEYGRLSLDVSGAYALESTGTALLPGKSGLLRATFPTLADEDDRLTINRKSHGLRWLLSAGYVLHKSDFSSVTLNVRGGLQLELSPGRWVIVDRDDEPLTPQAGRSSDLLGQVALSYVVE